MGPRQVARSRLLPLVDSAAASRLLLVHAPAGFGKSTLLAQWYERITARGEGAGWLTVDVDDNGAGRFARSLCEALAPGHANDDADLFDCINLSLASGRGFTLFLDEVEHLDAPEALHLLEVIIGNSPEQFHLVVGSRSLPQQLLRRARFLPDATVVTAEQLALSRVEIEEFLQRRGCTGLAADVHEQLERRTEGWAAALQLAAAALSEGEAAQVVIEHLAAPRAELVRYLGDELLARLPQAQARFLLRTSFLHELSAPLCDAVTGAGDARAMLESFEEHNLLLLELDPGHAWYRYHPLFAECLRQHLQQELPGELPGLAARASAWCAQAGLGVQAVDYALLAADPSIYLPRLAEQAEALLGRAQFTTVARWLRQVPRDVLDSTPQLLFWSAWVHAYASDFPAAEEALAALRRLEEAGTELPQRLRVGATIIRSMLLVLRQQFDEAWQATQAIASGVPAGDRHLGARVANMQAYLDCCAGDLDRAEAHAARALAECSARPPIWLSLVHAAHVAGVVQLARGNLAATRTAFQEPARLMAAEAPGDEPRRLPIFSILAAPTALAFYEQDQLEDAEDLLDRHEPFLDAIFSPSSRALWFQLRARLHGLGEQADRHEAVVREGAAAARRHGLEWMARAILWEGVAQELRQGRPEEAGRKAAPLLAGMPMDQEPRWIHSCDEVFGELIGAIRYFVQCDGPALALRLLAPHAAWDAARGRRLRLTKLKVLEALALGANHQREQALAAMALALEWGRACGLVRTFLDEGPACADLLAEIDRGAPGETATPLDAYRRHLLQAFGREAGAAARGGPGEGLAQPASADGLLSARERQIIERLALGQSNLVVSQQLFLSPNTVKWHLAQIYSKLGVKNRTQAVRVAQQQGLIILN